MTKIVVLDVRKDGLASNGSNVAGGMGAIETINNAEVVVEISQDGMWVRKGVGQVSLITVKSEAETSLAKAQAETAAREARRAEQERSQTAEDPLERAKRALHSEG